MEVVYSGPLVVLAGAPLALSQAGQGLMWIILVLDYWAICHSYYPCHKVGVGEQQQTFEIVRHQDYTMIRMVNKKRVKQS